MPSKDSAESIKAECGECGELYNGYHECPHGEDRLAYTCSDCGEHVVRTTAGFEIEGVAPSRCLGCTFEVMAQ